MRVTPSSHPFQHTGLDYAGPFTVTNDDKKRYILILVCMATKAVHIELTVGMTVTDTMKALRRFCARRGTPTALYSDNGPGFDGARRRLDKLQDAFFKDAHVGKFRTNLDHMGIKWHMIPPAAPHMGGLWEAAVKSAKLLFKKTFGEFRLSHVELETIFIECEAILNSRPLSPLRDDDPDVLALTPQMLLSGFRTSMFPLHQHHTSIATQLQPNENPVKRFRYMQTLVKDFWNRWTSEYLSTLQKRTKGTRETINIEVGDVVLIADDDKKPLSWPLGKVIAVHPGKDGIVRAATIETATGSFKRPVVKLRLLPLKASDGDDLATFGQGGRDVGAETNSAPEAVEQETVEQPRYNLRTRNTNNEA